MTEPQDKSTLPILLAIAGIVVALVAAGWLFLYQDPPPEPADTHSVTPPVTEPAADSAATISIEPLSEPAPIATSPGDAPAPAIDIEATFRKARLAAEADNLAYPTGRSALYFYAQILDAESDNAIAQAELDAVLSRIENSAAVHLAAAEFVEAHDLAVIVATVRPGHSLVQQVQQTIDELAESRINEAIQAARRGDDQAATDAIRAAQQLPGRDTDYMSAVRSSIADIVAAQRAAENQRAASARQAAEQALNATVDRIRTAILEGRLIEPPGDNAREMLVAASLPDDERSRLTAELTAMLLAESDSRIQSGLLATSEPLLNAAAELGADESDVTELRAALEQAFIQLESSRVISTADLVLTRRVSPRYPRRATERNISGWAEVYFTVTTDGSTTDIEIARSEPPEIFDQAALRAVEQWEFEPREFRGQLINQRAGVRLVFDVQ